MSCKDRPIPIPVVPDVSGNEIGDIVVWQALPGVWKWGVVILYTDAEGRQENVLADEVATYDSEEEAWEASEEWEDEVALSQPDLAPEDDPDYDDSRYDAWDGEEDEANSRGLVLVWRSW